MNVVAEIRGLHQVVNNLVESLTDRREVRALHSPGPNVLNKENQQSLGERAVTLQSFLKLNPPTFSGNLLEDNPQFFIHSLNKAFRALRCPDDTAMDLATYNLTGHVYHWYETLLQSRRARRMPPILWDEFVKIFLERFLLTSIKEKNAADFEKLRQTPGMSVMQYENSFTELSRYVEHLVTPDIMRVKRFVRGLENPYFTALSPMVGSMTYSEIVNAAYGIEAGLEERRVNKEEIDKKKRIQGAFSKGSSYGGHIRSSE
ncbi:uncharacterized protein [Arachis hypogaea]|uniref:uncharacterized protein n=1 Tax=Arachis hypogaea TaxID=3818 RepID=UPI0007AF3F44